MLAPIHRRIAGVCIPFSILRIDKNLLVASHTTFPHGNRQGNFVFDIHLPDFVNENAATANIVLTDFSIAMIEGVSS